MDVCVLVPLFFLFMYAFETCTAMNLHTFELYLNESTIKKHDETQSF